MVVKNIEGLLLEYKADLPQDVFEEVTIVVGSHLPDKYDFSLIEHLLRQFLWGRIHRDLIYMPLCMDIFGYKP